MGKSLATLGKELKKRMEAVLDDGTPGEVWHEVYPYTGLIPCNTLSTSSDIIVVILQLERPTKNT
jgi:hypothetical protein